MKAQTKPHFRVLCAAAAVAAACVFTTSSADPQWRHLSSKNGDLPVPNEGKEQTSTIVLDIDKDGTNDFVITERTKAPSVVWYRRGPTGWTRYVVDDQPLHIEAGSCFMDVDGDGDLDIIAAGDWTSNEIWWWENPYPNFDPKVTWKRHLIKNFGAAKHHDQIVGDFDGDGKDELVFWNQDAHKLFIAKVPQNPREADHWECTEIFSYSPDGEMQQRGTYPSFKQQYPERFPLVHLKELRKGTPTGLFTGSAPDETSVSVGSGQLDFPAILKACAKIGVKRYYIEDEAATAAAQIPPSIDYLKAVRY